MNQRNLDKPHSIIHDLDLSRGCRNALNMARAYQNQPHLRVIWQERAADYRETLIDRMRRRQGWSLRNA
jgi:hypothetical protein